MSALTRTRPRAYWWIGRSNFGDLLTPLLLDYHADVKVEWADPARADVVCVGSVLEHLPPNWPGVVAGAGKLREESEICLPRARILGLRGPLSARGLRGDFAFGDPALLANELVQVEKRYELGLVPHWSDRQLETRFGEYKPRIIRVTDDPLWVLKEIGRCRKIVSSSLHGIIVADAFGIPRRIETCPTVTREGGDFKFRDHNAAVGVPHEIGKTQQAHRFRVQNCQHQVWDVRQEVGQLISLEERGF